MDLFEQGLNVARVLEAKDADGFPLYPETGILMPRRSTKTTSIWAVLLGRCLMIPGYKVVTTAQDGTRARQRFREVARTLEATGFEGQGHRIRWANGDESFEFANGSRLWVVAPSAGAFRGEAADALLFDEAGEYDPAKSEDLMSGALPLLDTRPNGQAIIAGTPSKVRAGLLWETLESGRSGKPGTGVVDYSIRDDEDSLDREVWRRVHPGIGTLTTLARLEQRFAKMTLPQFEREYLCRFPFDAQTSALNVEKWAEGATDFAERPERMALGFDVAPGGTSAALVAAWRDEDGTAFLEVVAYRDGFSWLPGEAGRVARTYRAPVAYDSIGDNQIVGEQIARLRPSPQIVTHSMKDMAAAAALIANDVREARVRHLDQPALNNAVEGAAWRESGHSRLFARKLSTNDVAPLVAASVALRTYDAMNRRTGGISIVG
ncbi:hypothetical protein [Cellulosimicrobium marinum]|uniref:hypothetical protein n=1 Tax=Cellulosimicrobium marinum TaxID=1638992 RepID=UPI001E5F03A3|nr:hypothetical protein [Cellulosimicrobium marinum]MCB7135354.1 hypothetical protein [Cellulosimicrobium marinum]